MRMSRWVTAGVLFTGVVALAWAQQPGPGFGFGGGGPTTLVINKAVHEELKLSEEQVNKLREWAREEGTKISAMRKEKLADVDFKSEEGRAKFAAFNAESTKTAYADLEASKILTADQIKRVRQIDRQNQGLRFYTSTEANETLKINDEQKAKIRSIVDEAGKDAQAIRTEAGFGGGGNKGKGGFPKIDTAKIEEMNKKIEKVNGSAREKINEVLTADQRAQAKELLGEPFDTSKLRGGFGPTRTKDKNSDE